jgi:hypothetical protein
MIFPKLKTGPSLQTLWYGVEGSFVLMTHPQQAPKPHAIRASKEASQKDFFEPRALANPFSIPNGPLE